MDRELLEAHLSELPLYAYFYIDPKSLEFTQRVRHICSQECPMYNKTWACPPAVGEVEACKARCLAYENCLLIGTIVETEDIADIDATLATRPEHEALTDAVAQKMRELGAELYVLSTEACAVCERCAWLDGQPCRHPERMHPCVESHGINMIPVLEENGLDFQYGSNMITWYSLLFFNG